MRIDKPEIPRRDLPDRTFVFAQQVVVLCLSLEKRTGVSRTLCSQLLRSATSVGANVEEGQGSHSRADFASKYGIACREARETKYWLRLLAGSGIVEADVIAPILDEASQLVAILTTIVRKVKSTGKSKE
jgi:four helix bundle protein